MGYGAISSEIELCISLYVYLVGVAPSYECGNEWGLCNFMQVPVSLARAQLSSR